LFISFTVEDPLDDILLEHFYLVETTLINRLHLVRASGGTRLLVLTKASG